jgi:hypothetical protein
LQKQVSFLSSELAKQQNLLKQSKKKTDVRKVKKVISNKQHRTTLQDKGSLKALRAKLKKATAKGNARKAKKLENIIKRVKEQNDFKSIFRIKRMNTSELHNAVKKAMTSNNKNRLKLLERARLEKNIANTTGATQQGYKARLKELIDSGKLSSAQINKIKSNMTNILTGSHSAGMSALEQNAERDLDIKGSAGNEITPEDIGAVRSRGGRG